jgi:Tfp pilus assembly protein PilO
MNFERVSLLLKQVRFVQIGLLFVLLNAVLLGFLVLPESQKITRLQADYARQRVQIVNEQKSMRTLDQRLAALEKARNDLQMIYSQVLSQKKTGVTEIRQELEELAGSMNVSRENVTYSYDLLPEFGLRHFVLSVPVEGSYRDIRLFINGIERSQHFLILERVDLSAERSANQGDNLILNFQLSTYLRDEEARNKKNETRKVLSRP